MVGVGRSTICWLVACTASLFVALAWETRSASDRTYARHLCRIDEDRLPPGGARVIKQRMSNRLFIAYPFGVIGRSLHLLHTRRKANFGPRRRGSHGEICDRRGHPERGSTSDDGGVSGVQVTMVRKDGRTSSTADTVLSPETPFWWSRSTMKKSPGAAALGKLGPPLASDRADLDYIRVFVGKATWSECPPRSLPMPAAIRPPIACPSL